MSILEILLLGIGLSMDAFAVSICKGLSTKKLQFKHYLIIGAWFGGFQALMPTIGYFLGSTFEQYITAFDHWVAFVLLAAIGATLIKESFSDREGDEVHRNDTLQEFVSLSERFGIHVSFSKPDKKTFLHIVHHLAKESGIDMEKEELELLAERFALERGGRSARLARQFIDGLLSK